VSHIQKRGPGSVGLRTIRGALVIKKGTLNREGRETFSAAARQRTTEGKRSRARFCHNDNLQAKKRKVNPRKKRAESSPSSIGGKKKEQKVDLNAKFRKKSRCLKRREKGRSLPAPKSTGKDSRRHHLFSCANEKNGNCAKREKKGKGKRGKTQQEREKKANHRALFHRL